jgi:hypothetical protein
MPLVAGRKTWIRVHPRANTGSWGPIDGAILLKRGSQQEILYPVNGPIFTGLTVDRADADSALNFVLEPKWYAEGTVQITALVWAYGPSTLDDKEPNPDNNMVKTTVSFKVGRQPDLRLVPLDDGTGPGPSPTLGWLVFSALATSESIVRSHPIAGTNLIVYPLPLGPENPNGGWISRPRPAAMSRCNGSSGTTNCSASTATIACSDCSTTRSRRRVQRLGQIAIQVRVGQAVRHHTRARGGAPDRARTRGLCRDRRGRRRARQDAPQRRPALLAGAHRCRRLLWPDGLRHAVHHIQQRSYAPPSCVPVDVL